MTHQTDEELDTLVMRLLDFNGDGHTRFAGKTMTENAADAITTLRARVSQLEGAVMTGQGEQIRLAADLLQAKIECNEANARAALAASLPADPVTNAGCCQPVRVKPLVWAYVGGETWIARTPIGIASVQKDTHGWGVWRAGQNSESVCWHVENTLDAAKAAAQADYEGRILAALEPAPVTPAEAAKVQALVELAEELITAVWHLMDNSEESGPIENPKITVWKPDFDEVSAILDRIEGLPSGSIEHMSAGELFAANILTALRAIREGEA